MSTVINGGWKECFLDTYADGMNAELSGLLSACSADYLLLAARPTGSDGLNVLAAAPRADVLYDTGQNTDVTHAANGTAWYFNANYSWGFAPAGDTVHKNNCDDTTSVDSGLRLCWNLLSYPYGGYRDGANIIPFYNESAFERLVFEPGTRTPQTITFPTLPDVTYGDADITPRATSDSGLPVSYSTSGTNSPCPIVGGNVHIVGTGTCTVYANQAGDGFYQPAAQVSQSFTINPATVDVTPAPAGGPYGTIPSVTPTYGSFQYGESTAVLESPASCQANTTTTTVPGTYHNKSSCSGAAAQNYTFAYSLGTVTIVKAGVGLSTTATSATEFRTVGRMKFTTTAINAASHATIAGLSITVHIKINNYYTVTCTATTNASGVATCFSGNGNLLLIPYPHPYTATSPVTALYTAGSTNGTIPK